MDGEVKPGGQLGKYRLERLLGRGGMGEVWEAHDPDLDRRVALKLLHARIAGRDDARARFQREGRAMARLRHPNVIAVHDATFSGDRGVIAMELVDGENLATWAATPRDPKEIVRVILAAGRGLAAAHAAGMIHRDFKPHNVLIDRDGRVLVTDFGLARAIDVDDPPEKQRASGHEDLAFDETATPAPPGATVATEMPPARALTETGSLLGTPAYMAPEQHAGDAVDERCDVFAFCVTAWELFAGARPFSGETLEEILVQVKAANRGPSDKVPRSLRAILLRGLAWEASARWQKMKALLDAIERVNARPRRIAIAGGVVLGAGAIVAVILATRGATTTAAVCEDPSVAVASAWSPKIRADFESQLAGKHYKDSTIAFFERWSRVWKKTYAENCKKPQDPEFGARRECLDSIRNEVMLTTERSATLPAEMWAMPDLPRLVPPPETCALAPRSLAPAPPPADMRGQVAEIRIALAKARLPILMPSAAAVTVDVKPQIEAAIATKYKPVIVEATLIGALATYFQAITTGATPTCNEFDEPLQLAEGIGYDRLVVEILLLVHECIEHQDGRESEAAATLERLVRITERTRNPFQQAVVDLDLSRKAVEAGAIDRGIEKARAAGKAMQELGVDLWTARAALAEAEALEARHAPGDLERADLLLNDQNLQTASIRDRVSFERQRARIAWSRGLVATPTPLEPDTDSVPIRVHVSAGGAPIGGALVGTSATAASEAQARPLLFEALKRGAIGTTSRDGSVELSARRGALVIARNGITMGVAIVPASGADVAITLVPAIAVGGTTTGVHDRPSGDPTDFAGRSRRRGLGRVVLSTEIAGVPLDIHAPLDANGRWVAYVLPGTYLVALQAPSGLDKQAVMHVVDVRSPVELPPFALSTAPQIAEVLVRSKSAQSAIAYTSRAGDPLPATWAQLRAALRASSALTGGELASTRIDDRDTKRGDLITRLSLPGTPSVACALPNWLVATDAAMAVVSGSDDEPPVCAQIPAGATRVQITGR